MSDKPGMFRSYKQMGLLTLTCGAIYFYCGSGFVLDRLNLLYYFVLNKQRMKRRRML